jgi:hypothetical protein
MTSGLDVQAGDANDAPFGKNDKYLPGVRKPPPWATNAQAVAERLPIVDAWGHIRHGQWEGKVTRNDDLERLHAAEVAEIQAHPPLPHLNRWGGWADGPQQASTVRFRIETIQGISWFIDPDGALFWCLAVNCVVAPPATRISGKDRTGWFDAAAWATPSPAVSAAMKPTLRDRTTTYSEAQAPQGFSNHLVNIWAIYGSDPMPALAAFSQERLRSWGFTAVGAWAHPAILAKPTLPYGVMVTTSHSRMGKSRGYWHPQPDPFEPQFRQGLDAALQAQQDLIRSPWCLEIFVDNEMSWGQPETPAIAALDAPPEQPARRAALQWLHDRFQGDLAAFTRHTAIPLTSWPALGGEGFKAKDLPKDILAELGLFIAATYFHKVNAAIDCIDPQVLYLGCRFVSALAGPAIIRNAGTWTDVNSINVYHSKPARNFLDNASANRAPTMIIEFHIGSNERDLPRGGLLDARNDAERA